MIAIASFYEYLMAGRCTSLEGTGGAYNLYENEIRMNQIISQLDTVITSLVFGSGDFSHPESL